MSRQQVGSVPVKNIENAPDVQKADKPSVLREEASRRLRRASEQGGYQLLDVEQVHAMIENNEAMLVDLRDEDVFARGHLPEAINFPLPMTWRARLQQRWKLKRLLCELECRPVIFYGASPSCRRSDVAACAAVIVGFPVVYRFAGGVDAWLRLGLTLEIEPLQNGGGQQGQLQRRYR
ncbi:rhodanese-like domain-containing protein [Oleidesulfovibrio sp.]|uniref:rhodanese-like domain-containing protein n=1 Tax=Oleidesulfovibrio sp. TaxID=2909707 RepID=UPI003A86B4AC